jgi:hypothetical protein
LTKNRKGRSSQSNQPDQQGKQDLSRTTRTPAGKTVSLPKCRRASKASFYDVIDGCSERCQILQQVRSPLAPTNDRIRNSDTPQWHSIKCLTNSWECTSNGICSPHASNGFSICEKGTARALVVRSATFGWNSIVNSRVAGKSRPGRLFRPLSLSWWKEHWSEVDRGCRASAASCSTAGVLYGRGEV